MEFFWGKRISGWICNSGKWRFIVRKLSDWHFEKHRPRFLQWFLTRLWLISNWMKLYLRVLCSIIVNVLQSIPAHPPRIFSSVAPRFLVLVDIHHTKWQILPRSWTMLSKCPITQFLHYETFNATVTNSSGYSFASEKFSTSNSFHFYNTFDLQNKSVQK